MARNWRDHKLQFGSICILMIEKAVKAVISIIDSETAAQELGDGSRCLGSQIRQWASYGRITEGERKRAENLQQALVEFLRSGKANESEAVALEELWEIVAKHAKSDIVSRAEFNSVLQRMHNYKTQLSERSPQGSKTFAFMTSRVFE